jgi:hypothetical protein
MELKERIGNLREVAPQYIFLGVGSDEAIDILIRIFCVPGKDNIVITPPTYGMYKVRLISNIFIPFIVCVCPSPPYMYIHRYIRTYIHICIRAYSTRH